jgi:phosphoglycerol geranylgeranyltransferase
MVRAARESIDLPIVLGGGIVTPEQAEKLAAAGADIIVTGTLVENGDFENQLKKIVDTVHRV